MSGYGRGNKRVDQKGVIQKDAEVPEFVCVHVLSVSLWSMARSQGSAALLVTGPPSSLVSFNTGLSLPGAAVTPIMHQYNPTPIMRRSTTWVSPAALSDKQSIHWSPGQGKGWL